MLNVQNGYTALQVAIVIKKSHLGQMAYFYLLFALFKLDLRCTQCSKKQIENWQIPALKNRQSEVGESMDNNFQVFAVRKKVTTKHIAKFLAMKWKANLIFFHFITEQAAVWDQMGSSTNTAEATNKKISNSTKQT